MRMGVVLEAWRVEINSHHLVVAFVPHRGGGFGNERSHCDMRPPGSDLVPAPSCFWRVDGMESFRWG